MIASKVNPAWYVLETLKGAFPVPIPVERKIVASICIVYFDESGTHDSSDFAVVAGFAANTDQWTEFSQKWQQVLERENLEYFRMSDFENRQGQFTDWGEPKRQHVLNELLAIIHDHTLFNIGCIVFKKSLESLQSKLVQGVCGDSYGVAALVCWRNLGKILQEVDAWADCYMEAGAKGRGALQFLYEEDSKIPEWQNEHRILTLSFRDKRLSMPVQAADILAYELYKQSLRQFGGETRPTRYPLKMLARRQHKWVHMTDELLREAEQNIARQIIQLS